MQILAQALEKFGKSISEVEKSRNMLVRASNSEISFYNSLTSKIEYTHCGYFYHTVRFICQKYRHAYQS